MEKMSNLWEEVGEDYPGMYISKLSAREVLENIKDEKDIEKFWKRYHELKDT